MPTLTNQINSFVQKWNEGQLFKPLTPTRRSVPCYNSEVWDEEAGEFKDCDGTLYITTVLVHSDTLPPDEVEEVKYWECDACHSIEDVDDEELDFTSANI